MIIAHRINTLEQLQSIPLNQPIEFDVRDSNGRCIVQHDAFLDGLDFELFLKAVGDRFMIVNIKSEGIEDKVLELLKCNGLNRFFLLDCSFPKIVNLVKKNERRIAVRYSEYEDISTVLALKDKVEWVWIDTFDNFSLTPEKANILKGAGLKLCLVSPDLQKKPNEIETYIDKILADNIFFDAVCCKYENKSYWENYYDKIRTDKGLLAFHNGWTDIINSTALIHYFANKYKTLYLVIPRTRQEIYSYLIRNSPNVELVPLNEVSEFEDNLKYFIKNIIFTRALPVADKDINLMGLLDISRPSQYKDAFRLFKPISDDESVFWKKFYTAYNIPYHVRVNYFDVKRDFEKEDELYKSIVKKEPYVITHFVEVTYDKKVNDEYNNFTEERYELHGMTSCMFYAIKILMNAKEIQVIDSVWASVCYHLDVKYRLFENIPITVHCLRDFERMFTSPVRLPNWKFIKY